MAEYISIPSYSLIHEEGLSFDELALVEPLAIGAHGIRRAAVKPDEFALDINENRLQFCKDKLGVHYIINAKDADVLEQIKNITNNEMPTLVTDATGNQKAINNAFQYMAHGARFILIGL